MRRLLVPSLWLTACAVHHPRPTTHLFDAPTVVLAHRGYSSLAPENTMASFQLAADAGFGFELDVGLTADGVPVVLHDDTLDRTTDGEGFLDATPAEVVASLDAGAWFDPAFSGQGVPTLDAVFEAFGGRVLIDVEIKSPRDGGPWTAEDLGRSVADAIVRHQLTEQVFVTAFSPYVLEAVKQTEPRIRRGQLYGSYRGTHLTRLQKVALRHLWLNRRAQPDLLAGEHLIFDRRYVERMTRRGYRLAAWTVNEPAEMRRLVEAGVQVLITDRPEVARRVLNAP